MIELKDWMRDLATDRKTIGGSLDNISDLTVTVADLLERGRPLLKRDIAAAATTWPTLLNEPEQRAEIVDLLDRMPEVDVRPDPHRHLRLLVPVLRLRRLRADQAPRCLGEIPIINRSRTSSTSFEFQSTAPRCQDLMTSTKRRADHAARRHHPGA